ncbi:hypothetical protein THOM_2322 [Trachipleistophora hominis]|uniref:Uncharacterized protein n=1 Tax=Trachipleistophora hominis TaxID=72359 RepID=L7JUQ2_TRAHO|nr:hypothetical protein THOM_2322 [Trachipleistophora hominis]
MRIIHSSLILMLAVVLDLFLVPVGAEVKVAPPKGEEKESEGEVAKPEEPEKEKEEPETEDETAPTGDKGSGDSGKSSGSVLGMFSSEPEKGEENKSFWQRHKKTIIWCLVIFLVIIIALAVVGFILKRRKS